MKIDAALSSFLLKSLPIGLGFFGDSGEVARRNRERLKQSERNKAKYVNDFNRKVVKWQNDNINEDIKVDNEWQKTLTKLASDDLKLWAGMKNAGIAAQQAYAAMMSVGASEQAGRRSATTTNRRKAVLEYAGKMKIIAARLSGGKDLAALNRSSWAQEFTRQSQASHIRTMEGRPMPGTPPPSIPLENKPDLLTGLILPIAGEYLDFKKLQKELDPPYPDEEMSSKSPFPIPKDIPDATPGGDPWELPAPEDIPEWNTDPGLTDSLDIGSFFNKRQKNKASSQLGSKFLTSSLNQA